MRRGFIRLLVLGAPLAAGLILPKLGHTASHYSWGYPVGFDQDGHFVINVDRLDQIAARGVGRPLRSRRAVRLQDGREPRHPVRCIQGCAANSCPLEATAMKRLDGAGAWKLSSIDQSFRMVTALRTSVAYWSTGPAEIEPP